MGSHKSKEAIPQDPQENNLEIEETFAQWARTKKANITIGWDKTKKQMKVNWEKLKHCETAKVVLGGGIVLLAEYGTVVAVQFFKCFKIALETFFKYASKCLHLSVSGAITSATLAAGAPFIAGIMDAIQCCYKWNKGKYSPNARKNREIAKKELKHIFISTGTGMVVGGVTAVGVVAAIGGAIMATFWPLTLICVGCSILGLVTKWLLKTYLDTGFWFRKNKFRSWALEEGLLSDVGAPYAAIDFLKILEVWKIRKEFYQRNLTVDTINDRYNEMVHALQRDCSGVERDMMIGEYHMEKMVLLRYVTKIQAILNQNLNASLRNNDNDEKQLQQAHQVEDEVKTVLLKSYPDFENEIKSDNSNNKGDIDVIVMNYDAILAEVENMQSGKVQNLDIIEQCSNLCIKYHVPDEVADQFDNMLLHKDEKALEALPNIERMIKRLQQIQKLTENEQNEKLREKIFQKRIKKFLNEFVSNSS